MERLPVSGRERGVVWKLPNLSWGYNKLQTRLMVWSSILLNQCLNFLYGSIPSQRLPKLLISLLQEWIFICYHP